MKLSNVSEQSPIGAFLAVFGALGTVLAIGTIAWKDALPVLALTAGAGWMLAAAVVHANGTKAIRIKALETELADARAQAKELATTSSNVARAVTTILEVLPHSNEAPPPRRAPRRRAGVGAAAGQVDGDRE
jgi:hypothetical protein